MSSPNVIFYRNEIYSPIIDTFLQENANNLDFTFMIVSDSSKLNLLYNPNYPILITFGVSAEEYLIPLEFQVRRFHLFQKEVLNVYDMNVFINSFFVHLCSISRTIIRPAFSIFTTCYNSYDKILRAYRSLLAQTFTNWEWVILDDSPDSSHFQFLKTNLGNTDNRIRLYQRQQNSGNIGNVKNEAVMLCRGNYVLELDHDDEILPDVLKDSVEYFETNQDVGFIYMDFINLYEDGENFCYGFHSISKGYAGYYCQKFRDKWVYVFSTPNINNITLSHLTCCPNHPRIWRREILQFIGNYCEFLPICDDYEILLRTALSTKMAKICKLGYVQYMASKTAPPSNFSLLRNREINRIGPRFLSPIYFDKFKIEDKLLQLGDGLEDRKYMTEHCDIWERNPTTYTHKYINKRFLPNINHQYCILGLDALFYNLSQIRELYTNNSNKMNDFFLIDNKATIEYLCAKCDELEFSRFRCIVLAESSENVLRQYFELIYKSDKDMPCTFFSYPNPIQRPLYNTKYAQRHEVINAITSPSAKYLEIGIEYGYTYSQVHFAPYNKIGVDPDPKCAATIVNIIKSTSVDFFRHNQERQFYPTTPLIYPAARAPFMPLTFDVIFIDGMHQVEYVVQDFNAALRVLNQPNGIILFDDILPLHYGEQLKIPAKHYYENGILKYGESWTGDIWKFIYYLLKNYQKYISVLEYFYHANYRGILMLKFCAPLMCTISESELTQINAFDYYRDFGEYLKELNSG